MAHIWTQSSGRYRGRYRGGAHLDEVAGREEVDGEEHDEVHRDVGSPRRDDLRRGVGVGVGVGI